LDLPLRSGAAGARGGLAASDSLYDVQVVQRVIRAAVVRQSVQQQPHDIFGGHANRASIAAVHQPDSSDILDRTRDRQSKHRDPASFVPPSILKARATTAWCGSRPKARAIKRKT